MAPYDQDQDQSFTSESPVAYRDGDLELTSRQMLQLAAWLVLLSVLAVLVVAG